MPVFEERIVLADAALVEIIFERGGRYRLRCLRGGEPMVEYGNDGKVHRRRRHGREQRYEFRSVEQLRYDFEREVENAQHQG